MSMRFSFPVPQTTAQRGAAPVGQLGDLPGIELAAIVYLRSWCDSGAARDIIARDFQLVFANPDAAAAAVTSFDHLMDVALRGARRPLMRHGLQCKCFGGDESAFANMVAAAVTGDREDAMLFASTLLSGPAAFEAVRLAGTLAPAFLRLARSVPAAPAPTHTTASSRHH